MSVTNRMATVTAEVRAARHMARYRHSVVRRSTGDDQAEYLHKPSQVQTLPLGDNPPF